jgi:hypothetical protein
MGEDTSAYAPSVRRPRPRGAHTQKGPGRQQRPGPWMAGWHVNLAARTLPSRWSSRATSRLACPHARAGGLLELSPLAASFAAHGRAAILCMASSSGERKAEADRPESPAECEKATRVLRGRVAIGHWSRNRRMEARSAAAISRRSNDRDRDPGRSAWASRRAVAAYSARAQETRDGWPPYDPCHPPERALLDPRDGSLNIWSVQPMLSSSAPARPLGPPIGPHHELFVCGFTSRRALLSSLN